MAEETVNIIPLYDETVAPDTPVTPPVNEINAVKQNAGAEGEKKEDVPEKPGAGKKIAKPIINIISGNIFTKEEVMRHLPYVLFLAFIALLYIANGYYAEDAVRKLNKEGTELKELRSEYITTKSDLMHLSKQSEVAGMAEKKIPGLKESLVPPKKIIVKN